ncbi:MAG: menaquinone biosynthesis protein [Acidobacteriota bacterium]
MSYLNTVPLVWGLLKDPAQAQTFDLRFALPSVCADQLASGEADIGIVPVIEMARQKLAYFHETGIASFGTVRSILLISKVPFREIRKLATDSGSRTSVMLSRIILAEKYGVEPEVISHPPDLAAMLGQADAALLIGDAALRVDPATLPFETLDLGKEWTGLTGLPMVFAVWAGSKEAIVEPYGAALAASCRYGLAHIEEIVRNQTSERGFPELVIREYLTHNIQFEFSGAHHTAIETYLKYAAALERTAVPGGVPA